jgi:calcineurin-like phosphoesterase family protein
MIFITADWHLGESRFHIMGRPFSDVQLHVDTLVENHNKLVSPNDIVYVNGDAIYQGANPEEFLPQISRFNGRKVLVRGNHDRPFSDEQFAPYFEQIIPEGEGVELEIGGIPCYITHYPSRAVEDRFNLIGHIHSAFKVQLNMLNVGVDVHHFCPVHEDQIPFTLKAITDFYDNDVWAAYNQVNSKYINSRGKKSNYFTASKS